eukprot:5584010-Pyramimonas_sp.AAC.1
MANVLTNGAVVLLVTSTTGDGDPPDHAALFYAHLRKKSNPDNMLAGVRVTSPLSYFTSTWLLTALVRFALLGLGDQNYTAFMAVPRTMWQRLEQ